MTTQTKTLAATMTALALSALASGCGPDRPAIQAASVPSGKPAGRHVYLGLDTSASWRSCLGVSATLCARTALRLDPNHGDRLTLYRLDSSAREFCDGPAPESGDRLQRTIITEVQSVSQTRGTFPARFWTAVAERAQADASSVAIGSVAIGCFSDGDNDDQTAAAQTEIRRAARRLAANPRVVSISIWGAAPRNWAALRAEFAPLGDRFHLCPPPEMTLDRVAHDLMID